MRTITALTILLSVLFCGGCATLLRGSRQTLSFATYPPEAVVELDGVRHTAPFEINVRRKTVHHVVVSKDGYRTVQFDIDPQWDGVSLVGNIILPGGSVGLVIDSESGADQTFYKLAKIRLIPSTRPDEPPLVLNDFKGHLMTDEQVRAAKDADQTDRTQFFRGEP